MASQAEDIGKNGWTAVPVDAKVVLGGKPYINKPEPLFVKDIPFPFEDPIVSQVHAYAKEHLPPQTFNHSMRVFYFGMAIVRQQFPEHATVFSPSTYALTCLLHDIGTTTANMAATRMSFEFHGAMVAHDLLARELSAPRDQADAVAETIIRHQDLGTVGTITLLGQIVQLATIYDNVTAHPDVPGFEALVHEATRDDVHKSFPRGGWLGCFADTIRREIGLKPWCHTTHIPDFDRLVEGNAVMKKYE